MKLSPYKPNSEPELHDIIMRHLEELDEDLKLVKHEFMYESKRPDFLFVDKEGRLVVLEVKVGSDERVMFQVIKYFQMVNQNKYLIQKTHPEIDIDPEKEIRIIVIAGDFTEDIKNIIQYLEQLIELYKYQIFKTQDGKDEGIFFEYVDTPITTPQEPMENYTLEEFEKYPTNSNLSQKFKKIVEDVNTMNFGIEPKKRYVAFKYKGKNIGEIRVGRKFFWLISWEYSAEGREKKDIKVETGNENINEIYNSFNISKNFFDNK